MQETLLKLEGPNAAIWADLAQKQKCWEFPNYTKAEGPVESPYDRGKPNFINFQRGNK
jgi:hypothetical protein